MTVHKFQGFEAGFSASDSVNRIIADIDTLAWEKMHVGTAYVVTSRAKTIGTYSEGGPRPTDSAIYWEGEICEHRFMKVREKQDGDICLMITKRDAWVKHLEERAAQTSERYDLQIVQDMKQRVQARLNGNRITTIGDLKLRIANMLVNPNEQWTRRRLEYLVDT